ncbi:MAG TPA: TonB-dependent receptor [Sphingomonas sp.]|nr:TonB-dependent receptor [Sphingomonas sp.]
MGGVRGWRYVAGAAGLGWLACGGTAHAQSIEDLRTMSISQLAAIDVSSVSKTSQPLSDAPAAIYVITHDDIERSGATTLPEILRLAPNLEVMRTSASNYVITARGLNGSSMAQNFSNKLLVLIDGRSVYTPLYSGVYWDMQDVLPEDIDRIEVISGPGATLWGANAVNGVINIITRKAGETQGAFVNIQAGGFERTASARYGGAAGDDLNYRLYVRGIDEDQTHDPSGAPAHDGWSRIQGGFRVDWTPNARDAFTLQGDAYGGTEAHPGGADDHISGRNLLARWNRTAADGASLQVQAYYDRAARATDHQGGHFAVDTYDLDLQHSLPLGGGNTLVWGGGVRASHYNIVGNASIGFVPPRRTLLLGNIFAQDSLPITGRLTLTAGVKLEDDPYAGVSLLPDARLSWKVNDTTLFWGAVSRAVRSPTPFDEDVVEKAGDTVLLHGSPDFRTEKLTAYELGARLQPGRRVSFSVSGYYNLYDDLRSVEITPVTFFPIYWGNKLKGHSYGLEAWGDWRPANWWTLSAGVNLLSKHFHFAPGSIEVLGTEQLGDDPGHQFFLRSSMNLGRGLTLGADFRAIGALPAPHVPAYAELNARLGWTISPGIELSVSGFNLLHARHLEYPASDMIPREVLAGVKWRF